MSQWLKQLKNPPAAFRGAPFWAWNGKLDKKELVRQVGEFAKGGLGGFFMHVRYGMETEYLSPEFFDLIKAVVAEAKKKKLEAWLYDEDRWPSGFAGGKVTANPEYRLKSLLCDPIPSTDFKGAPADAIGLFTAELAGNVARNVRVLPPGSMPTPSEKTSVLVFSLFTEADTPWFNDTANVDSMNPDAIGAFIKCTHEEYKKVIGKEFGKTVPGIFTDEPNIGHMGGVKRDLRIPWTGRFLTEFQKRFGYGLTAHLPELYYDVDGVAHSRARRDYRRLTTELYVEAYGKQLGQWCGQNNLELTGHLLSEESLQGQINQAGDCMPHYEWFQRPAIDILKDVEPELLTVRQCVSAASQLGRSRVLSELYGCTGWDFTFEGYKHIGDWHQVLGVNSFCHHLSWYAMEGGAKRDYPASIFYQSPWWKDHALLGDYFARLSLALSQGQAVRETAVIHPIESAWLVHRKKDERTTRGLSESLERLCKDLLDNQFDFEFACEALLPKYGAVEPAASATEAPRLRIGKMSYRAVIVPEALTLRESTVTLLEKFVAAGGRLVFVGQRPELLDCEPNERLAKLAAKAVCVPTGFSAVYKALRDDCRPVMLRPHNCGLAEKFAAWVHLRKTDAGEVLFVHHRHRVHGRRVRVLWQGRGRVREINPLTGEIHDVPGVEENGARQEFDTELQPTGARLFLRTAEPARLLPMPTRKMELARRPLNREWDYELDEPNALVLDFCRMRVLSAPVNVTLDGERHSLWKLDRSLRRQLGYLDRAHPLQQPYVLLRKPSEKSAQVELEFEFDVETPPVGATELVLEHPERFEIFFNDKPVKNKPRGWFIDRCLKTVPLNGVRFKKGPNRLRLITEYREFHWLEEVLLIGRFGARVGKYKTVTMTALPKKLHNGDWCGQNLAMYSGAVTYKQKIKLPADFKPTKDAQIMLCLDQPKASVIRVAVNGKTVGKLGWAPWRVEVSKYLRLGQTNELSLTLVSSRRNVLGPLHHVSKNTAWTGPAEFRTEKDLFTAAYNLVPYGLLGEVYLSVQK
jgi:hypothetical protein